jgi:hypothetical protein
VLTEIETDVDAGRYSYYSTSDTPVGPGPAQTSRETTSGDR